MSTDTLSKIAVALTLLLVVGIAYSLADAAWFVMSPPEVDNGASATPAPGGTGTGGGQRPRPSIGQIAAAELFGKAAPQATQAAPTDAPITTLNLQLFGVLHADEPDQSSAIIAERSKPGKLFHVGDTVVRNTTLEAVYANRVLLRRGGKLEQLEFPNANKSGGLENIRSNQRNMAAALSDLEDPDDDMLEALAEADEADLDAVLDQAFDDDLDADDNAGPRGAAGGGGDAVATLRKYQERLNENPDEVMTELGLRPVQQGSARGYRISREAGANLSQIGLQPGDVVVSVNGRPVGNLQTDQQRIDAIVQQGAARIEVQRGTRRFFVTASLR